MTDARRSSSVGWSTTIQDRGRPGLAHIGVPPSGPSTRPPHRRSTGWSATRRTPPCWRRPAGCVVAGDRAVRRGDVGGAGGRAPSRPATDRVDRRAGPPRQLWAYLAVRGGLDVAAGARLAQPRHAVGARPAAARPSAQRLAVGADPGTPIVDRPGARSPTSRRVVGGLAGPARRLVRRRRAASASSPTRGPCPPTSAGSACASTVRRSSAPVTRRAAERGAGRPGAIQVPPDGRPVVMLADHPTTGGYPVIAVVDPATASAPWCPGAPRRPRCASARRTLTSDELPLRRVAAAPLG